MLQGFSHLSFHINRVRAAQLLFTVGRCWLLLSLQTPRLSNEHLLHENTQGVLGGCFKTIERTWIIQYRLIILSLREILFHASQTLGLHWIRWWKHSLGCGAPSPHPCVNLRELQYISVAQQPPGLSRLSPITSACGCWDCSCFTRRSQEFHSWIHLDLSAVLAVYPMNWDDFPPEQL